MSNPKSRPKLAVVRPTRAQDVTRVAERLEQGSRRLNIDMPIARHRALKRRALDRGMTVRQYLLELLERDGVT